MTIIQKTLDIDASMRKGIGLFTEPENLSMSRRSREEVTRRRPFHMRSLVTSTLIALLLCGLALLPGSSPHARAMAENSAGGHMYILNNDLSGSNSITVFNREKDGSLKLLGTHP
jgi:hypothetical protein